MTRVARWERVADRWRVRLPVPRYLRHSPLRGMRERIWFVSRLQPRVEVAVNLAQHLRIRNIAAPPSTVFLHQWLTAHTSAAAVDSGTAAWPPQPGAPLVRMSPLARSRIGSRPTSVVMTGVTPQAVAPRMAAEKPGQTPALFHRLASRTRRVDDVTDSVGSRVVKRGAAGAASEAMSVSRETAQWGEARSRVSRAESALSSTMTSAPPPAVNVEQLTDQVLRQLDRRLIASRERLGRI